MRSIVTLCLLLVLAHGIIRAQSDSAYFEYVLQLGRTYVNDHSLVYADGQWHLFFTQGDMSIRPWMSPGNEIEIGHAVSADLRSWTTLAPALRIGPSGSLDGAHVYAPFVFEHAGIYHMFYTGTERGFFSGERIFRATSTDLVNWTRAGVDPVFLPDTSWAEYRPPGFNDGPGGPFSCRDPFVIGRPEGGFVLYYVARLRDTTGGARACVAAATSDDLVTWIDRGPVLTREVFGEDVNPYTHPESPCIIMRDGRYHMFWKGGSGTHHASSADPLDFEDADDTLVATSHASKVFEWSGAWYITSCSRDVNDVMHTRSDRTRGLYLAGLQWAGGRPHLAWLPAVSGAAQESEHWVGARDMSLW